MYKGACTDGGVLPQVRFKERVVPDENEKGVAVAGIALHVNEQGFGAFGYAVFYGDDIQRDGTLSGRDEEGIRQLDVVHSIDGIAQQVEIDVVIRFYRVGQGEGDPAGSAALCHGAVQADGGDVHVERAGAEALGFEEYAGVENGVPHVGNDELDGIDLAGLHNGFGGEHIGHAVIHRHHVGAVVVIIKCGIGKRPQGRRTVAGVAEGARKAGVHVVDAHRQVGTGYERNIGRAVLVRPGDSRPADEEPEDVVEFAAHVFRVFLRAEGVAKAQRIGNGDKGDGISGYVEDRLASGNSQHICIEEVAGVVHAGLCAARLGDA